MARSIMVIEIDTDGNAEVRLSGYPVVCIVRRKASNLFEVERSDHRSGDRTRVADCMTLMVAVLTAMDEMAMRAKDDGITIEGFPVNFRDDARVN